MSSVISKAGMWQTKGLGITIDEVMEAESRSRGQHRVKTGWGGFTDPDHRVRTSKCQSLDCIRITYNNSQAPHTDVSDSVFLAETQGSVFLKNTPAPKSDVEISERHSEMEQIGTLRRESGRDVRFRKTPLPCGRGVGREKERQGEGWTLCG